MKLVEKNVYKNKDMLEVFSNDEKRYYVVVSNGRIRFDSNGFIELKDVSKSIETLRKKMSKFIKSYC